MPEITFSSGITTQLSQEVVGRHGHVRIKPIEMDENCWLMSITAFGCTEGPNCQSCFAHFLTEVFSLNVNVHADIEFCEAKLASEELF